MIEVYIGLFFVLFAIILIVARYLIAFLMNKNEESLTFGIKCLELDKEISDLELRVKEKIGSIEPLENQEGFFIKKEESKLSFVEELSQMDDTKKNYYNAIIEYALEHNNVKCNTYKTYQSLTYGKGKIIAKITARNGDLIVKFNFGKIKVKKGMEPLKLRTIRIVVKDEEDLENVKRQIETGYIKQSGALSIAMKEGVEA